MIIEVYDRALIIPPKVIDSRIASHSNAPYKTPDESMAIFESTVSGAITCSCRKHLMYVKSYEYWQYANPINCVQRRNKCINCIILCNIK